MIKTVLRLTMAASLLTLASVNNAGAQTELNNRTKMTFAQPVEVPGKVLPAGTYTFELHDSGMNRHVIEIFDEGGTKLQALVLAVPSYRPKPSEDTVVKFDETTPGQPQAIRIWYYPGQTTGNEFVYSKSRAKELAAGATGPVQSTDDSAYTDAKMDTLKSAEVTPYDPKNTGSTSDTTSGQSSTTPQTSSSSQTSSSTQTSSQSTNPQSSTSTNPQSSSSTQSTDPQSSSTSSTTPQTSGTTSSTQSSAMPQTSGSTSSTQSSTMPQTSGSTSSTQSSTTPQTSGSTSSSQSSMNPQTSATTPQSTTPQTDPTMTQSDRTTPASGTSRDRDELPHTASTLPVLFLIGGALLLIGIAVRAFTNRKVMH